MRAFLANFIWKPGWIYCCPLISICWCRLLVKKIMWSIDWKIWAFLAFALITSSSSTSWIFLGKPLIIYLSKYISSHARISNTPHLGGVFYHMKPTVTRETSDLKNFQMSNFVTRVFFENFSTALIIVHFTCEKFQKLWRLKE